MLFYLFPNSTVNYENDDDKDYYEHGDISLIHLIGLNCHNSISIQRARRQAGSGIILEWEAYGKGKWNEHYKMELAGRDHTRSYRPSQVERITWDR